MHNNKKAKQQSHTCTPDIKHYFSKFINIFTYITGKLVCVHGTIMKAGNRQLLCQYMAFQCRTCNGKQNVRQTGGLFKPPSKCETKTCRAQSYFEPLLSSPYTRAVDWQSLKIQELSNDTQVYKKL